MSRARAILDLFENISYEDAIKILGVSSGDDVDKAYKKAALKHHPDRGGSDDMMKKVNQAYDLLKKRGVRDTKSFDDRKREQEASHKKQLDKLKGILKDIEGKLKNSLKKYEDHFKDYFTLSKPELKIQLRGEKNYWYTPFATIDVQLTNDDGSTWIKINATVNSEQGGGISYGDDVSYSIGYETLLYHNRKTHAIAKNTYKFGTSNALLDPEMIFPKARLEKIVKKAPAKMSRKDFLAAIYSELRKYKPKEFNDSIYLQEPIKDDIHLFMYRSVFMRQAGWNLLFKRVTNNGRKSSSALFPESLPSHIKYSSFSLLESLEGFELLKKFVEDAYKGKTVDKDYFKKLYEDNTMSRAAKIIAEFKTSMDENKDKEKLIDMLKKAKSRKELFRNPEFEKLWDKTDMTWTEFGELKRIFNRDLKESLEDLDLLEKLTGGKAFQRIQYGRSGYTVTIFNTKDDKAYAVFTGFAEKENNGYFEPKNQNRWYPEITAEFRKRMESTGDGSTRWDSRELKVSEL
jgi:curved DNA-binding protein CbpA